MEGLQSQLKQAELRIQHFEQQQSLSQLKVDMTQLSSLQTQLRAANDTIGQLKASVAQQHVLREENGALTRKVERLTALVDSTANAAAELKDLTAVHSEWCVLLQRRCKADDAYA